MLKAKFLGIPALTGGTDASNLSLNGRDLALFAYLCVTRRPHSRSVLADLLWSNYSEQEAKNNLRYILRSLKKDVGDYIVVDGQAVAFNQELPYWCDATVFMTHLAPNVLRTPAQVEPTLLQGVLDLYDGEFLAGFQLQDAHTFERWLFDQKRNMNDLLVYGVQLSVQHHLDCGDYEAGLALNQYLLTLEPWREEAHRQRMLLLAASGQRSAALIQYDLCCQVLEEELDAPPMNETTSLYLQIKSGQWFLKQKDIERHRHQRIAVRAYPQAAHVNTVPVQTTTAEPPLSTCQVDLGSMPGVDLFVGRQHELALLQQWVGDGACQLVAVLGLGGQGKSALAARFVHEQIRLTPDKSAAPTGAPICTVIWRSLARRPSWLEILQEWVQQLTQQPRTELTSNVDHLLTTLFAALEERRCLFVLDGVEAVLQSDQGEGQADAYEKLFQLFIQRPHRGCLLLTSRIRPSTLIRLEPSNHRVLSLELTGLSLEDGSALLAAYGITAAPALAHKLQQRYAGHPQLLLRAADLIHEIFGGDGNAFLADDLYFIDDIGKSLTEQLAHCTPLERHVIQALAATCQAYSHQQIWPQLPPATTKSEYYQALRHLQRSYLIQQEEGHFTLAKPLAMYLGEQHPWQ